MEINVRTSDRLVLAYGIGLGTLDGTTVETISDATAAELLSMLATVTGDGGVSIGMDRATLTLVPPSAAWIAEVAAQQQAADDNTTARNAVITLIQSTVGITWANLTAAQKQALIVSLLYRVGALDKTLAVQPLANWL